MIKHDEQNIIYISEYKRQKLGQTPKLFKPIPEAIQDNRQEHQPIPTVHEIQLSNSYWQNFYDD